MEIWDGILESCLPDNKLLNGNRHEYSSPFFVFWPYLPGDGNEDRALGTVLHDGQSSVVGRDHVK